MGQRITWREKVEDLRVKRGLSKRVLAKRMGYGVRTVTSWLRGDRRPLEETAVVSKLAAALQVTSTWLLNGREEPPPSPVAARTIPPELIEQIPTPFRRLVYAAADPETATWLLAQLDLYEQARGLRARAR